VSLKESSSGSSSSRYMAGRRVPRRRSNPEPQRKGRRSTRARVSTLPTSIDDDDNVKFCSQTPTRARVIYPAVSPSERGYCTLRLENRLPLRSSHTSHVTHVNSVSGPVPSCRNIIKITVAHVVEITIAATTATTRPGMAIGKTGTTVKMIRLLPAVSQPRPTNCSSGLL